jgi:hypothetical protein
LYLGSESHRKLRGAYEHQTLSSGETNAFCVYLYYQV